MRVVSLFAGCGGLDLGFIQAGHEVIWANDNDKDAVETYRFNIGDHITLEDIKNINGTDIPDSEIITAGLPCQGFSIANFRRRICDERNSLYLELIRILESKQPMYFVIENVKGIMSMEKGKVFSAIIEQLENCNYKTKHKLVNAADFGVPQMRWRVFIVGVRKDIDFDYAFPASTHAGENSSTNAPLEKWVSISDALSGIPEPNDNCNILNHDYSRYKTFKNKNFTGHRMVDPNKPSPTILARGNGKGGVVVIHHPKNHRRMSVRETALVQTFSLDYRFFGSRTSCYRQIGNAVPPLLAKQIASKLPKDLNSNIIRKVNLIS